MQAVVTIAIAAITQAIGNGSVSKSVVIGATDGEVEGDGVG